MTGSAKTFYWGGFLSNKLDIIPMSDGYYEGASFMPALFYNKRDAKARYQDVRRVSIIQSEGGKP